MKDIISNTFNGGLQSDLSPYIVKENTYTDLLNGETVTHTGNEFILKSAKGTVLITTIESLVNAVLVPRNILTVKVFNGIAYIVSNIGDDNIEIGTYPSPNYNNTFTGSIVDVYTPLQNYALVFDADKNNYGDFTDVDLFGITDVDKLLLDIEIQSEYDGTVNIILTDKSIKPVIINSAFEVSDGDTFNIIDRIGKDDSNYYIPSDIDTTLKLLLSSPKILNLSLTDITNGGRMKCGNYYFYFRYATKEEDLTDIIEQSRLVSLFKSNGTLRSVRGGEPNESSNKIVQFSLSNIDTSFNHVKVYFSYATADKDELSTKTFFEIDKRYIITGNTLSINITGYELFIDTDLTALANTFSSLESMKTIAQVQNRLIGGNIKESNDIPSTLKQYANTIQIGDSISSMHIVRSASDIATTYGAQPNHYPLGYANPLNIYNNLSYWGGESYSFGIVYILNDGSLSNVYPIKGVDRAEDPDTQHTGIVLDDTNDFFDTTNAENLKGFYRFPIRKYFNRTVGGLTDNDYQLLPHTEESIQPGNDFATATISVNKGINIMGVTFKTDVTNSTVLNDTIGCFFVRSKRKPNILFEGVMTPTMKILPTIPTNYKQSDPTYLWDSDSNKAYCPIPGGISESFAENVTGGVVTYTTSSFFAANSPVNTRFISTDKWSIYTPLNARDTEYSNYTSSITVRAACRMYIDEFTDTGKNPAFTPPIHTYLSTYYTTANSQAGNISNDIILNVNKPSTLFYTNAHNPVPNIGKFCSSTHNPTYGTYKGEGGDTWLEYETPTDVFAGNVGVVGLNYNPYIGVSFNNSLLTYLEDSIARSDNDARGWRATGMTNINGISKFKNMNLGYLIDVYNDQGFITDKSILKNIHSDVSGNTYEAISKRMTWNEVQSLETNNTITVYGGDCFIGLDNKILYNNSSIPPDPLEDFSSNGGRHAPNSTICGFVYQADSNFHLKDEEIRSPGDAAIYGEPNIFSPYAFVNESTATYEDIRTVKYKQSSSENYNAGYEDTTSNVDYPIIDTNSPLLKRLFPNRVIYSSIDSTSDFTNGYRQFFGSSFVDYPTHYGEITKIMELNGNLLVVNEHGVIMVGVNERSLISKDGIQVESTTVLTETPRVISDTAGSKWINSIVKSDSTVYGVDVDLEKIWRVTGSGLEFISDFKIESSITPYLVDLKDKINIVNQSDISAIFDQDRNEILFSFKTASQTYTYIFNETLNIWITKISAVPTKGFSINNKLFSFENNILHEHHKGSNCKYYENQEPFIIEFIANKNSSFNQMFTNLRIISNKVFPVNINTDTDILQGVTIVKDIADSTYGFTLGNTRYNESYLDVQIQPSTINSTINGKYCRVKITYTGENKVILQAIQTFMLKTYI